MSVQRLEKAGWRPLLDHFSKLSEGREAEVEATSLALGDQTEAKWLPLLGLTYDPKDDVIELALDGLDHMIHGPRDVFVDVEVGLLASVEIIDAVGVNHIIKFKDPLLLPRP